METQHCDNFTLCFNDDDDQLVATGARDFRKKSNKAVDGDPNLDDTSHNEDLDGALYSGNNELVYGL